jgi:hypothetical protein
MKPGVIIAIAAVLVIGAFVGGWYIGSSQVEDATAATPAQGPEGLSEEDRAAMQEMSPEERQEFMAERGIELPAGGMGRPDGAEGATGMRGGQIEGEVIEMGDDTLTLALTDGGSQTVYIDGDTVIAYEESVVGTEIAESTPILLLGQPEADGVMTATMLIVTQ